MFRLHSSVWRQCETAACTVSSTLSTHPDCGNWRAQAVVAVGLPCFTGTTAVMSHGSVALAGIKLVSVPNSKPNPALIAFSITHYTGSGICARWGLGMRPGSSLWLIIIAMHRVYVQRKKTPSNNSRYILNINILTLCSCTMIICTLSTGVNTVS